MIGLEIKNVRVKAKVTQKQLADKAGVTKGFISRIENTGKLPRIQTLTKILDALGLELKIVSKKVTS